MIDWYFPNSSDIKEKADLLRIGSENDGGYVISKQDMLRSQFLISGGISDDWNFELEFSGNRATKIFAVDASVSPFIFFKRSIKSLLSGEPSKAWSNLVLSRKLNEFIRHDRVEYLQSWLSDFDNSNSISLDTLFDSIESHDNSVFIKIDIEGGEYRLLDILIENQEKISGCVIEFHDCDIHYGLIERFIEGFGHDIVYVQANNFGRISSKNQIASLIEITFSRGAGRSSLEHLSRFYRRNCVTAPDYIIAQ